LHAAVSLQDLRVPPGNHLEALKGDRAGSTAYGSTTSGAFASTGKTEMPTRSRSSTTTDNEVTMSTKLLDPIHPGEILAEEFMRPLGLSANALARTLGVPVTRISEILRGRRGVSADSALRLARFVGSSAELWMSLQADYDLRVARRSAGNEIRRLVPASAGNA